MIFTSNEKDGDPAKSAGTGRFSPPSINLPKGGGAIRSIGEKFAANPVTGTGTMSVPIATSPGRAGFGPQLSLSYDSGNGNGPFGIGWSLSLPSITRKTDKGLPLYDDATESDAFILSGAEDLVPEFKKDKNGKWVLDNGKHVVDETRSVDGITYTVRRYRPRIEGLFARIERWTRDDDPADVHWRSITKDDVLTLYGKDESSRIQDPAKPDHIYTWLISETRDDKGNGVLYEYKEEDGEDVDLTSSHEANRGRKNDQRRQVNRYIKRIRYGNRAPLLVDGHRPPFLSQQQLQDAVWKFDVVFDYEEGRYHENSPDAQGRVFATASLEPPGNSWAVRPDPFSVYRTGFEIRTYRLCHRVLMFHHFPRELDIDDYLVRSTEFSYSSSPIASFITSATQSGFVRQADATYLKKFLPPLDFEYSRVPEPQELAQRPIRGIDADSLENLPIGLDGSIYQWVDLDGEGASGILTEQADGWYYKRNRSANCQVPENGREVIAAHFGPAELVASKPAVALKDGAQFLDLGGDGQVDVVQMEAAVRGFYERTDDAGWEPFRPFASWPNIATRDPNLKFTDLTGDGHADMLIAEGEGLTWYPSLAEEGFGPATHQCMPTDEEQGPRLVFADGTQSVYLADLSGDGLSDLVRIQNGEVIYYPNLGYGRFGPRVTMDNAPWFDSPDQFDQKRIRLVDVDGSGTTDIIYLHRDGAHIYFNRSGNCWSDAVELPQFPPIDNLSSVQTLDLLGNGTGCLVWSSPLPGDARQPLRYIALMDDKPHLLVHAKNNLGAETLVHYASSTKFYLDDVRDGKPWITRLPFPVHVVDRVDTFDRVSRNHFVTCYTYHHGYFDGEEREFRGFGMVEQKDTEEFAALTQNGALPNAANVQEDSHVPPVLTRTWFHTGAFLGCDRVSNFYAGLLDGKDRGEYYREPAWLNDDAQAQKHLLDDTALPPGLTPEEAREACRALKGSMLRQEVYALDGTATDDYPFGHPYTVTEQNLTIRLLQPRDENRHAVFLTHPREAINYHYERNPSDPRVQHALTLDVDEFGNVLRSIAAGYPRAAVPERQPEQEETHLTLTLNRVINRDDQVEWRHISLPAETRTYEVVKPPTPALRFSWQELHDSVEALIPSGEYEAPQAKTIPYEQWDWRKGWDPQTGTLANMRLRLIEHVRTRYRPDDLGEVQNDVLALKDLGEIDWMALPGESYKLAFTPTHLIATYGARATDATLRDDGRYVRSEGDANWWIPSGRVFYSPDPSHTPTEELAYARAHFFLPMRYRDQFHKNNASTESFVTYDDYDLLVYETRDALGNKVTSGERKLILDGTVYPEKRRNNYRVLQPELVMDRNRDRAEVAYDALGMVVGTAVMGKPEDNPACGDILDNSFACDLTEAQVDAFMTTPREAGLTPTESLPSQISYNLLGKATTRVVYDVDRYKNSSEPAFAATIAREMHVGDLPGGENSKLQISFSYSDGFGREIQKKIQAEPGPIPVRDGAGKIIVGDNGRPQMTVDDHRPRWVGTGWTVFNNKGKPVRQYEPFFTDRHTFEFDVRIGVSPVLFYDPVERVVATLHPNHTWEKVVFDPWRQETWDVSDTVAMDPKTDPDVGGFFQRLDDDEYLPTWYALRTDGSYAVKLAKAYPDAKERQNETRATAKSLVHKDTSTVAHADSLGRTFLTIAHNKAKYSGAPAVEEFQNTRLVLDIEGNQREVVDARDHVVMHYDYDMVGNRVHQVSLDAGERWMLNDVTGKPLYAWDSRNHCFFTKYDQLRRPTDSFLKEGVNPKITIGRTTYGDTAPDAEKKNLRGKVIELRDQAGIVYSDEYDFKGNLIRSRRRPARSYKTTLDWSGAVAYEPETYSSATQYDALNRASQLIAPHSDQTGTKLNVVQPVYNEANLLERVDVWLNRGDEPSNLLDPASATMHAVTDIDYDAKGQRTLIDYGNGVRTTYDYDPFTFRLAHLLTVRDAIAFPGDSPEPPPDGWPGSQIQNLYYIYDPMGNITHIRDDAQQTIYFRNKRVEPSAEYSYDALYRLIEATGREHLGQIADAPNPPTPHSYNDAARVRVLSAAAGRFSPYDKNAMGGYRERYVYDGVGNMLSMRHEGTDPAQPGWRRCFQYDINSNRLLSTTNAFDAHNPDDQCPTGYAANPVYAEKYQYDAHGNMLHVPQLATMQWDFKDELQMTQRQKVNDEDAEGVERHGERTWYVYDSAGQRVRKVTELTTGDLKDERIYLGGFEIYRQHSGNNTGLVRETLHIMDDKQRIALVEMRNDVNDGTQKRLIRYQYGNHLGSAVLELDDQAQIISYEEYTPYGSTAYQAVRNWTETPKRYRYTGKERDEESGLYYHGARYYAPWIARWTSCDPLPLAMTPSPVELPYPAIRSRPVDTKESPIKSNEKESQDDISLRSDTRQIVASTVYGYADNNPCARTDPDGLQSVSHIEHERPQKAPGVQGRINFAIYYLNPDKDPDYSFERAAKTFRQEFKSGGAFDPTRDEFVLIGVKTEAEFNAAWQYLYKESQRADVVVQFGQIFTHASGPSSSNRGLEFAPGTSQALNDNGTLTIPEIGSLPALKWGASGRLVLSGCNTGVAGSKRVLVDVIDSGMRLRPIYQDMETPSPAQEFALAQGVTTAGLASLGYFSRRQDVYEEISTASKNDPMYSSPNIAERILWLRRLNEPIYLNAYSRGWNSPLGSGKIIPANVFSPGGTRVR